MSIANNFEEILLAFNNSKVEYMLSGGFAVNYHGFNRSTSDLDVWVKPIEENKTKVKKVNYISLKDLIVNKMLTGRTKDKLDVEELQKISVLKNKK